MQHSMEIGLIWIFQTNGPDEIDRFILYNDFVIIKVSC